MFDIAHIREELNELPFRDGKREVFVGRVSEVFEGQSEETITDQLAQFEQELRNHTLILTRHEDDRDALFVVQELRRLALDFSWMAEGMNWVSRITTVALEMVLPGLAGLWLDNLLDTRFFTLLGFACGVPLGMWHLIAMTKGTRSDIE
jgi:hypothetical protein